MYQNLNFTPYQIKEWLERLKMQKGDNAGTLSHVKITEYPLGDYKSPLILNPLGQNIKQLLWSGPGLQCRQKL